MGLSPLARFAGSGWGGRIAVWREHRMVDSVHISMYGVNGKSDQWAIGRSAIERCVFLLCRLLT